jgi:hypothetical protein
MDEKTQILAALKEEFERWDKLLAGLSVEQITAPRFIGDWSIKDLVAHLMAWQIRSIARLEAAIADREPVLPGWPPDVHPEIEENLQAVNAWIYQTYHQLPWEETYRRWKKGYLHLMELGAAVPAEDLSQPGRYAWMEGKPLALVLHASYDHHHEEHYGSLQAVLSKRG